MRVVIVGVGGIGTNLIDPIARVLEFGWNNKTKHTIILVDGDTVETKNLMRQNFYADHVGESKALAFAKVMADKGFENIEFACCDEYLNSKNIGELICEGDIVLSCVDNHPTRKLISDWAQNINNLIVISGGNELETGNVQTYIRYGGVNITGPLTENHPEIESPPEDDKHPEDISCEERIALGGKAAEQTIRANIFAATIMLSMFTRALSWITDSILQAEIAQEICFNTRGFVEPVVIKRINKEKNLGKEENLAVANA